MARIMYSVKLKNMQYAIIDESGRFGDPKSRIIVFSVVAANSLVGLDKVIPAVKKKLPLKGPRKKERTLAEIKFSKTGDKTRKAVLGSIARKNLEIFLLIVETEGRKVKDNPENYSLLVSRILATVKRRNSQLKHVVIDRHFTWIYQREKFNEFVQQRPRKRLFIEHLDSQQNTIVSLPDFVAGGIRENYTKEVKEWRRIIRRKIVYERKVSWKDLRKQKR